MRAVTASDKATFDSGYLAANPKAPPRYIREIRERNRIAPYAEAAPAYSRFVLAPDGELWVSSFVPEFYVLGPASFRAPHDPTRWSVFSPAGEWLADVTLPARFVLLDMGRDYVAGVRIVDDMEQVVVLRLLREPR